MGKAFYSWQMQRDPEMPGMVARCTTIPEELGRISYLVSDKTGTLTENCMVMKKLSLGQRSYTQDVWPQVFFFYYYYFTKILYLKFILEIISSRIVEGEGSFTSSIFW